VVLIDVNREIHLIRRTETLEDVAANELVPAYLA
jgi:hypothetical protein